ncbi:MAG: hypothetical protein UHM16_02605 [Acutalibacteraceae bacterium]|jgi:hypothetical protein|nr:hypothetical protein [Acutalibacteraceae bacterium]
MVSVKEIENYKEYGKCVVISNGEIEAYVTVDLGPRIIRFGFLGGKNILFDNRKAFTPKTDKVYTDYYGEGKAWENFGGHRVWMTKETYPETYTPDDQPVKYTVTENGAVFEQPDDTKNGVKKMFEIKMDPDDANMQIKTTVKNISENEKEFAVWCISVAAADGTLIIPMNTNDTGYLANRTISVWPYTDLSDSRLRFGKKYVTVKQDTNAKVPFKIGLDLNGGQVYYVNGNDVFCKKYENNHPDGIYPDNGVSFETYTNNVMIEIENLSEVKKVASGEENTMVESWSLFKKPCEVDFTDENSIDAFLTKI